jgi:hypothetical protein
VDRRQSRDGGRHVQVWMTRGLSLDDRSSRLRLRVVSPWMTRGLVLSSHPRLDARQSWHGGRHVQAETARGRSLEASCSKVRGGVVLSSSTGGETSYTTLDWRGLCSSPRRQIQSEDESCSSTNISMSCVRDSRAAQVRRASFRPRRSRSCITRRRSSAVPASSIACRRSGIEPPVRHRDPLRERRDDLRGAVSRVGHAPSRAGSTALRPPLAPAPVRDRAS